MILPREGHPGERLHHLAFEAVRKLRRATEVREVDQALTQRAYGSFSQTILPLILDRAAWPDNRRAWFEMIDEVIIGKALGGRTDREGILAAYRANAQAARALEAEGRALVFRSRDGWGPLCDFLGVDVPHEPYPKTNPRAEFFATVKSGAEEPAD